MVHVLSCINEDMDGKAREATHHEFEERIRKEGAQTGGLLSEHLGFASSLRQQHIAGAERALLE